MIKGSFWFCLAAVFACLPAQAATEWSDHPHSRARLVHEFDGLANGRPQWIGIEIVLEQGWHTYWRNPGDSGAAPIFNWQLPPGASLKEIQWPTPERISVPPLETFGYKHWVVFFAELNLKEPLPVGSEVTIALDAEWLVCQVECLPATGYFAVTLPVKERQDLKEAKGKKVIKRTQALLPLPHAPRLEVGGITKQGDTAILQVFMPDGQKPLDFFPFVSVPVKQAPPIFEEKPFGEWHLVFFKDETRSEPVTTIDGLLVYADGKFLANAYLSAGNDDGYDFLGLIVLIVSAFAGGLILNVMPCVFPVLAIKMLSLLKGAATPLRARLAGLLYSLGVLVSFAVLTGLLLALKAAGEQVGWGFQLQSPLVVFSLMMVFAVLAFHYLGAFEFILPGQGLGQSLTSKRGLAGDFFTGLLAVVAASPCTAPFMGGAIGVAMTRSVFDIGIIFFSLALGFAAPFLAFSIWPKIASLLPRPGRWLLHFKKFMAIPMLATVAWLTWVLWEGYGSWSVFASLGAVLVLALMATGLKYGRHNRWLQASLVLAALAMVGLAGHQVQKATQQETRLEDGWLRFSPTVVEKLRAEGHAVFIDFTAAWCLTCKVNERLTFSTERVKNFISTHNVKLVKADWTHKDPVVTRELERYGRIGVPFYLFWPAKARQPVILPEVLTPDIFIDEVTKALNQKKESL